ncbi:hypothetical protein EHQ81_09175 [Leptospira selangorensis]|uniref:Lipoprotein n=1 Tax=Leptospira selangorensis TaxID=2484982 RepID=A0A5F2C723_9LEPT|nr:hypothetical protein [Leptospira selangorensis]TGM13928.1 hypothetical protein EHQ81_09175 [Leptospira selangorensis]TGM27140.1 hypothetical protein EHQ82_03850 [Leptospira selangorensis]
MKSKLLIPFCILTFSQCAYLSGETTGAREGKSPAQLYSECMSTFSDDAKCKEFVLKSIPDADVNLLGQNANQTELEASAHIFIRSELIQSLLYQNKLYVKNKLGEPDEKRVVNNWAPGMEEWLYYKPVSKFAEGSRPDREILIRFQRGAVVHVGYTPPRPNR